VRRPVRIAASVGLAVAVVSYLAPHAVSAAVSGVGGLCVALAVQGALWARPTRRAGSA
jgi:hypothetical protein